MTIAILDLCEMGGYMYALVQRNGGTTFEKYDPLYFTDSALKVTPTADVAAGFDHLASETVTVRIIRDAYDPDVDDTGETLDSAEVDEDGEVALKIAEVAFTDASEAECGLPFTAIVEPVPPQIGPRTRLVSVTLDLFETREIEVGGFPLVTRLVSDPLDGPLPLVSGFYKVPLRGWGPSKTVEIRQSAPQPMLLRGWELVSA